MSWNTVAYIGFGLIVFGAVLAFKEHLWLSKAQVGEGVGPGAQLRGQGVVLRRIVVHDVADPFEVEKRRLVFTARSFPRDRWDATRIQARLQFESGRICEGGAGGGGLRSGDLRRAHPDLRATLWSPRDSRFHWPWDDLHVRGLPRGGQVGSSNLPGPRGGNGSRASLTRYEIIVGKRVRPTNHTSRRQPNSRFVGIFLCSRG